jgi:hypothetical protein
VAAGESARAKAGELRERAQRNLHDAEHWEAGAVGEERVAAALAAADNRSTRVLHDRLSSSADSLANLDHIVVSAAGIHLIDAKNWTGSITVQNDSLWQHWTTSDGRRSAVKNGEVDKVRRMAAQMQTASGQSVQPVLCLAGDQAEAFGDPMVVRGVDVVPVNRLVTWLAQLPQASPAVDVATQAVQLSCVFPPAVGTGVTFPPSQRSVAGPRRVSERHRRPRSPRRRRPASRQAGSIAARLVVGLVGLVLLVTVGPWVLSAIAHKATEAITHGPSSARATPSLALSAPQARALDDWRIRAGLYAANNRPAVLSYTGDANLAYAADACKTQQAKLVAFRHGLLNAPDPKLVALSKRYDRVTQRLLHACMTNKPVALHHAQGAMTVTAAEINSRYARLLGQDPESPYFKGVL